MAYKKNKKKFGGNYFFWAALLTAFFIFVGLMFFSGDIFHQYEYQSGNLGQILTKKKTHHVQTPAGVRGVYMTSWTASEKTLRDKLIKLTEETEINSIIIDIKDYTGRIAFLVDDPGIRQIGSTENKIRDIDILIKELHAKNVYVVGRIAVFQDAYLSNKDQDLAVKKRDGRTIWKDRKGISWLDPCAREVWEYTAAIAREAEEKGFDELNFDYIRFPSDGNMNDIEYSHCDHSLTKADLLESFFHFLKKELGGLGVPLSVDLFGMTANNTDDLGIGQVLERADPYFDFISPMVYPSHYPDGYGGFANPSLEPYKIIKTAMTSASIRLKNISSNPNKIRPWLQDFNLGARYDATMIRKEKQAVYDAGLDSWMLWSPSNGYTADALDKE